MTEEVTNLIAEWADWPAITRHSHQEQLLGIESLRNALVRSAAQTNEAKTRIANAEAIWQSANNRVDARYVGPGMFNEEPLKLPLADAADRMHEALSVAVVPEAVKPIERPGVTINKSLAELLKLDEHPQVEADWQERMRSIAEAEFRAWAARDIRKLSQMDGFVAGVERVVSAVVPEDPKPLDPTPWFRWCDSEMPGAPAFERYARQSNGTEFKPREGYEQDESRYGVTPKAGA